MVQPLLLDHHKLMAEVTSLLKPRSVYQDPALMERVREVMAAGESCPRVPSMSEATVPSYAAQWVRLKVAPGPWSGARSQTAMRLENAARSSRDRASVPGGSQSL